VGGSGVRVAVKVAEAVAVGSAVLVSVALGRAVSDGLAVALGSGVRVTVALGMMFGALVRVAVAEAVAVGATSVGPAVLVGVIVGGSPCNAKSPEAFQPVPTKICTW
jgi:hypothetical protein